MECDGGRLPPEWIRAGRQPGRRATGGLREGRARPQSCAVLSGAGFTLRPLRWPHWLERPPGKPCP